MTEAAKRLPNHRETTAAPRAKRGPRVDPESATAGVVLFPDTDTNYANPAVGKAAVEVLEAANIRVAIPDLGPTGRAAYSTGMLEVAAEQGEALLEDLEPYLERGWSVLFVEPSDAAMVVDEYRSLLDDERVDTLAANAFGVCEYLDRNRLDEELSFDQTETAAVQVTFHGHCHQKARGADHHAVGVLRRAGYAVDPVDSGCCGMAGSFGYEAEHYDLSKAIGSLLRDQLEESRTNSMRAGAETGERDGTSVVAPGTSCRTQIGDFEGYDRPAHPVELLARAL
jgi:Fe-S oxidoreductase